LTSVGLTVLIQRTAYKKSPSVRSTHLWLNVDYMLCLSVLWKLSVFLSYWCFMVSCVFLLFWRVERWTINT